MLTLQSILRSKKKRNVPTSSSSSSSSLPPLHFSSSSNNPKLNAVKLAIRSKPGWEQKLNDKAFIKQCEHEDVLQGANIGDLHLAIDCLRKEVAPSDDAAKVEAVDFDAVREDVAAMRTDVRAAMTMPLKKTEDIWIADNIVPRKLREILEANMDIIASSSDKDLRPETDNQVQDLVQPSLFPYIAGTSYVPYPALLPREATFQTYRRYRRHRYEDSTYQWLPAQFAVSAEGRVEVKSYINNLDRLAQPDLYKAIELIFEVFRPMFERCIGKDLLSRELQVIVKAANYIINPKSKPYEGNWHLEGMSHEHIVATGIYYYSTSSCLRDDKLEFRIPSTREEGTPLGAVPTSEGRCLVFKNQVQHRVAGIANKSKDSVGTRKILTFFLVDPDTPIISTQHVPEQQWERNLPRIMACLDDIVLSSIGRNMPPEILFDIMKWAKWGFTKEEAHEHWLNMIEERKPKPIRPHMYLMD